MTILTALVITLVVYGIIKGTIKAHNARMMQVLHYRIAEDNLENLAYHDSLDSPIEGYYETDNALMIYKYAYGNMENYDDHIRTALFVNAMGHLFVVEKGGVNKCSSEKPYLIHGEQKIRKWIMDYMPPDITYEMISSIAHVVWQLHDNNSGLLNGSEFLNDVLDAYIEALRDVPVSSEKLKKINAVERSAALASDVNLEKYKKMEFIDDFNAAVRELGDERFNRYCELAYRHAAARGTDEWYDLYKDFMVAVKGWWGNTVRRVVVVRFENWDTPIRKVITER